MDKSAFDTLMAMQNTHVLGTYAPAVMFERGQGSWLWDACGKKYLDFAVGISVCNLGHCHPRVSAAVKAQVDKLVHVSNLFYNENQPRLAALIAKHSFGGRVFFCNSGAEANEGLIKFARRWGAGTGRYEIICMEDSFHGRTLATLAATGRAKYRKGFAPDVKGFSFVPFNDLDAVSRAVGPKTVAVLLEPIQGEGGIIPADGAFLTGVRELCDRENLLLLFDEVQCGMGRTGTYFAHQNYQVVPDAMSMAKALGNGIPIGAFEVQQRFADVLPPGTHASTFGGTPLACAAGIAVFESFEQERILENVRAMSSRLWNALGLLQEKHRCIVEVRGKGLMIGVDLKLPVKEILQKCLQDGLIALSAGETVLRLLPPLTVSAEEVDMAISIIDSALSSCA